MDQRLNVRPETIKILEENIGTKISDIAHRNILSDLSPQARETKEKINKCDYINQSLCTAKATINHQPAAWENISADTSKKELISKFYKEVTKLNNNKKIQIKNWQKT